MVEKGHGARTLDGVMESGPASGVHAARAESACTPSSSSEEQAAVVEPEELERALRNACAGGLPPLTRLYYKGKDDVPARLVPAAPSGAAESSEALDRALRNANLGPREMQRLRPRSAHLG